jgi:hypothetical protein
LQIRGSTKSHSTYGIVPPNPNPNPISCRKKQNIDRGRSVKHGRERGGRSRQLPCPARHSLEEKVTVPMMRSTPFDKVREEWATRVPAGQSLGETRLPPPVPSRSFDSCEADIDATASVESRFNFEGPHQSRVPVVPRSLPTRRAACAQDSAQDDGEAQLTCARAMQWPQKKKGNNRLTT